MANNLKIGERYLTVQLIQEASELSRFFVPGSEPIKKIHQELRLAHDIQPKLIPTSSKYKPIVDTITKGNAILIVDPISDDRKLVKRISASSYEKSYVHGAKYRIITFTKDKVVGVKNQSNAWSIPTEYVGKHHAVYEIEDVKFRPQIPIYKQPLPPNIYRAETIAEQLLAAHGGAIRKAYTDELEVMKRLALENLETEIFTPEEWKELLVDFRTYKKLSTNPVISNEDIMNFYKTTMNDWITKPNLNGYYTPTNDILQFDDENKLRKFKQKFMLHYLKKIKSKYFFDKQADLIANNI